MLESRKADIMSLIAQAPWREAVTYRETWPHEYVLSEKDGQQDAVASRVELLMEYGPYLPFPQSSGV